MKSLDWVSKILVIVGAIHVGIGSFSEFELINVLQADLLITIVIALVGLAGVWELIKLFKK